MPSSATRFTFDFDPRSRPFLALLGVTPATAYVEVGDLFRVRFGPWRLETTAGNLANTEAGGPYRWYRALGAHLSLADRGLTFGTNARRGLCVRFRQPVPGQWPRLRHPGVTVTVTDPGGLAEAVEEARDRADRPGAQANR